MVIIYFVNLCVGAIFMLILAHLIFLLISQSKYKRLVVPICLCLPELRLADFLVCTSFDENNFPVFFLSHSVPLTVRLVEEYNKGLESGYIEYPTPLSFSSELKLGTEAQARIFYRGCEVRFNSIISIQKNLNNFLTKRHNLQICLIHTDLILGFVRSKTTANGYKKTNHFDLGLSKNLENLGDELYFGVLNLEFDRELRLGVKVRHNYVED
ncbi:hypothetical protein BpHYR1_031438 [Brachionus plicatilis]|uniref:Uncharacterized protein n=1 Tax=Brachionus plicatilis TaxID=10195 RepID=A0A3M7Q9X8_BRAPC|nr:hypothetical protein BpHYR1_031438 [Brachionus plicatilis]